MAERCFCGRGGPGLGWGGVGREQVGRAMCEVRGDVRAGQAAEAFLAGP